MDVALFITCLVDTFEPRVGVAVVRLLRHFGCTVRFDPRQTCCGQPHYNNGFSAEAADLGRRLIDVFAGAQYVVTPSSSCAAMVRKHLPELLADDPAYAARSRDLAERTWVVTDFVTCVLGVDPAQLAPSDPVPATYHYSCHNRALQPLAEAQSAAGHTCGPVFRPLPRGEQCCGFGGAFNLDYPDISQAMVTDKLDCIAQTGARLLVCNETGCGMTIGGAARRRGMNLRIKHLVEIWAEALGLMDEYP